MKERFLTVLVPITDADVTATYQSWQALITNVIPGPDNINNIYLVGYPVFGYMRSWLNPNTNQYEFHQVVDREFPRIGRPMEIFDFTYDATRMGTAPTISAQGVMWFADKDAEGNDVTLEGMWSQVCHVSFDGENYYLKQIPTSTKDNEDARYKYDLDFVSEREVLEHVYLYDVVQPYVTERPISENSVFSFYGDVTELAKRINASLQRSGLAELVMRDGISAYLPMLTYEEWNSIGLGTYTGDVNRTRKYNPDSQSEAPYIYFYPYYGGDYSAYLRNEIYQYENGEFVIKGYQVKIGNDKTGNPTTSEEKLVSFDNAYIHNALQQIHDTFELQYYIYKEKDNQGQFTGNTIIMIADCEHDFADMNAGGTDFVRDDNGIPTSSHPVDYGVDKELLSKEKANATDEIVTRITGVGSSDNIPWYYPNPNPDGWIKPVYKRNDNVLDIEIDYPLEEGDTTPERVRYERYLKNRIGDSFVFGRCNFNCDPLAFESNSENDAEHIRIIYKIEVPESEIEGENEYKCRINMECTYESISDCRYILYKGGTIVHQVNSSSIFYEGYLSAGTYYLHVLIQYGQNPFVPSVTAYYYYPPKRFTVSQSLWDDFARGTESFFPAFLSTNPDLIYVHGGKWDNTYIANADGSQSNLAGVHFLQGPWFDVRKNQIYVHHKNSNQYDKIDTFLTRSYPANHFGPQMKAYLATQQGSPVKDSQWFVFHYEGSRTELITVSIAEFISNFMVVDLKTYHHYWYRGTKVVNNADWMDKYGIGKPVVTGGEVLEDSVSFQRVKYVTPQPNLMPEVYIKTDGERRYYDAHNYYDSETESLYDGTADPMIGEVQDGSKVKNPIYKEHENDSDSQHYQFENEYIRGRQKEHIENFDDVKPSIVGNTNCILLLNKPSDWDQNYSAYYIKEDGEFLQNMSSEWAEGTYYGILRIDVVEEFAFDELDNNEIWEDNSSGNISGEYKHPYFFAKLRPLGFNLFDLALQDDMVLSLTTGHCGACSFKIGVDENTKKNPVQVWEYDVYEGSDYNTKVFKYPAGELRRYVDTSNLYYDTTPEDADGYILVDTGVLNKTGFLVDNLEEITLSRTRMFSRTIYSAEQVVNGEVGALKQELKTHFDGDVKTNGRFIASQQDTSENYVWVALMKDTDTYGVLMPSAQPDYNDEHRNVYIEPKGHHYIDRSKDADDPTREQYLSDDEADKFVLINIKMPQEYIRQAERDLSRKLVAYMYDNNYQKFNFSIKFSRIFLAQNLGVSGNLNENSVVYVTFNNKTYRQYVKHYTYRMSHDTVLPEIDVEMNEELNVTHTAIERQAAVANKALVNSNKIMGRRIYEVQQKITKRTIDRNSDTVMGGNLINRDMGSSVVEISESSKANTSNINDDSTSRKLLEKNVGSFVDVVNEFNAGVDNRLKRIRETVETRLMPTPDRIESCSDFEIKEYDGGVNYFWLSDTGQGVLVPDTCPPTATNGMTDIEWTNYDF